MADTKQVTGPVKPFYDDAQAAIDEQAILDKYNAATMAQFAAQREQNRQNENKFYNQMYNTQKTAMDTIRQSNAAAVSSGASRGVQAANELSALLGLEQESVASATELAQANRQTAQEETAAVLENVLKAYQDAAQQRSDLTMQGIQAASLGGTAAEREANAISNNAALQSAAKENSEAFFAEMQRQGINNKNYSGESVANLNQALKSFGTEIQNLNDQQYAEALGRFSSNLENYFGITVEDIVNNLPSSEPLNDEQKDIYARILKGQMGIIGGFAGGLGESVLRKRTRTLITPELLTNILQNKYAQKD